MAAGSPTSPTTRARTRLWFSRSPIRTAAGGRSPRRAASNRNGSTTAELYYLALDGKLMAVPVNPDRTFQAGSPTVLFQTPLVVNRGQSPRDRRYDVAPDGRFLIAIPAAVATQAPITVVVNWTGLMRR